MARPRIGEERREEILTAFERCVVRKGLLATTLADVAEEAGQPRSLVRYFIGNRDDMVAKLLDRMLERSRAQLRAVQAERGPNLTDAIVDLVFEKLFADEVSNIVMVELWYLSMRDEAVGTRIARTYRRLIEELARQMVEDGRGADDGDTFDRAYTIVSIAMGDAVFRKMGVRLNDRAQLPLRARSLVPPAKRSRSKQKIQERA
jgi:AcrR family transcriptional regulator